MQTVWAETKVDSSSTSSRRSSGSISSRSSNLKQDVAADCDLYRLHLKSQRTFGMCSVATATKCNVIALLYMLFSNLIAR